MSITIRRGNLIITTGTVEQAVELIAQLEARDKAIERKRNAFPPPKHKYPAVDLEGDDINGVVEAGDPEQPWDRDEMVRQFLMTLKGGDVDTDAIQRVLRVMSPKGIGGRLAWINEYLIKLGFELQEVYLSVRTLGGRAWSRGSRIDEAIAAVERNQL